VLSQAFLIYTNISQMKGFLNKVQRRVSGSGPAGAEGGAASAAPVGGASPDKAVSAAPASPKSAHLPSNTDVVPKADVTLPRKERR